MSESRDWILAFDGMTQRREILHYVQDDKKRGTGMTGVQECRGRRSFATLRMTGGGVRTTKGTQGDAPLQRVTRDYFVCHSKEWGDVRIYKMKRPQKGAYIFI